ncbi:hypothetical protein [Metamycoplasma orale]|uniref:Uncharacterized protein n=1 Tax=Metamycoplasma orale TaxID=2121 RepID=A0A448ZWA0_METOS|nr:hypothetical protein [Metamycoplasma orale]VEU55444.1 Uncharacterised protein [Metamycoplasma orale]
MKKENKDSKKSPNKNPGDIIKERKLTKNEFLLIISQFKDIEYKELVFKKDKENFYMCALCNERNFKEDMPIKKPFDEDKFALKILVNFKTLLIEDILPEFGKKLKEEIIYEVKNNILPEFGKKLKEEIMNEINPRFERLESFHKKDIEKYNQN